MIWHIERRDTAHSESELSGFSEFERRDTGHCERLDPNIGPNIFRSRNTGMLCLFLHIDSTRLGHTRAHWVKNP